MWPHCAASFPHSKIITFHLLSHLVIHMHTTPASAESGHTLLILHCAVNKYLKTECEVQGDASLVLKWSDLNERKLQKLIMLLFVETFKPFLDYKVCLVVNRSGQIHCLGGITKVTFGCFSYLLSRFKKSRRFWRDGKVFPKVWQRFPRCVVADCCCHLFSRVNIVG